MQARFLHIPKTAGTSIGEILSHAYATPWFICYGDWESDKARFVSLTPEEKEGFAGFRGHSPFTTGFRDVDELPTFTFFREPVARVISFSKHVSEGKSPYLLERFPPESFDLDEFLASGVDELHNLMTRMILAHDEPFASSEKGDDKDAVPRALALLKERKVIVGVTEQFELSVCLIARKLGWSIPYFPTENMSSRGNRLVFEPRHLEQIRRMNANDIRLYAEGKQWFWKSVTAYDRCRLLRIRLLAKLRRIFRRAA
jgi:hypothetical protein